MEERASNVHFVSKPSRTLKAISEALLRSIYDKNDSLQDTSTTISSTSESSHVLRSFYCPRASRAKKYRRSAPVNGPDVVQLGSGFKGLM